VNSLEGISKRRFFAPGRGGEGGDSLALPVRAFRELTHKRKVHMVKNGFKNCFYELRQRKEQRTL